MGGRIHFSVVALLCAAATCGVAAPASAAESAPNLDWTSLLPAEPGTPTEPQPGPVPLCQRPTVGCVDRVIRHLRALRDRLGCDHRGVFATTYLELTRELRRSFDTDPGLFAFPEYLYTQDALFADFYLDEVADWERGARVAPAWRIAFEQAERGELSAAQDMLLGINAHVQNDMPFVIAALGVRTPDGASRKPDHDAMNEVLNRAYDDVVREVRERYDANMALSNSELTIADDVAGLELARTWREQVWRNAERLLQARTEAERALITAEIEQNAAWWARGIAAAGTPGTRAARDAYCSSR